MHVFTAVEYFRVGLADSQKLRAGRGLVRASGPAPLLWAGDCWE